MNSANFTILDGTVDVEVNYYMGAPDYSVGIFESYVDEWYLTEASDAETGEPLNIDNVYIVIEHTKGEEDRIIELIHEAEDKS